jgi:hypothetical protein
MSEMNLKHLHLNYNESNISVFNLLRIAREKWVKGNEKKKEIRVDSQLVQTE